MKLTRLNIHLLISSGIVIPVGIIYGFFPSLFLEIQPGTIDEENFNKAIMMLYLGFSVLWLLGVFKPNYLKTALMTNMIFMFGLAFGRIMSMMLDGIPTAAYVYGTVGELVLGFYGAWVLKTIPTK